MSYSMSILLTATFRTSSVKTTPRGEAPAYAGTDFVIARDGQIAAVYLFFDKLP
jgi:hypothetical protein